MQFRIGGVEAAEALLERFRRQESGVEVFAQKLAGIGRFCFSGGAGFCEIPGDGRFEFCSERKRRGRFSGGSDSGELLQRGVDAVVFLLCGRFEAGELLQRLCISPSGRPDQFRRGVEAMEAVEVIDFELLRIDGFAGFEGLPHFGQRAGDALDQRKSVG